MLRIIQRQFFLFLNETICCDPSLEPSPQDGSNDGSQSMFLWKNMDNYPKLIRYPFLSGALVAGFIPSLSRLLDETLNQGDIGVGGRLNPSSLTNSPPIHKDFLDISHNDPAHLMHVVSLRKVMEKCDKNQIIHSLGFHEVYHAVDGNHFADGGLNSCMVNPDDFQNSKSQHSNNTRHVPRELRVWQFPGNYLNNYFQFG